VWIGRWRRSDGWNSDRHTPCRDDRNADRPSNTDPDRVLYGTRDT
jgi:hypothetical protein